MSKTEYYYKNNCNRHEAVITITDDVYISAWYTFQDYGISADISIEDFNDLSEFEVKEDIINYYKTNYKLSDKETFDRVFNKARFIKEELGNIKNKFNTINGN